MNYITVADLIRPVGSVYFSEVVFEDNNWDPNRLFGGNWTCAGTIRVDNLTFNVWYRTE